jgi:hypothetical protein
MTFQGDPYRTLGIPPGASLNEIRSAYRRLAKQYHPDAAGERALPRFLAIRAAYERLVDGEGRLRAPGTGGPRAAGSRAGGGEPWRADPARARASRDAWRARRSAGSQAAGGAARGSAARGSAARPDARAGSAGNRSTGTGAAGARPGTPGTPGTPGGGRSERGGRPGFRTATPGSTTYDEAAEAPLDPEWDGGAWYGPSSGTYWTLNPREYADPRKHGPEYLERARRASPAAGAPDEPDVEGDPVPGTASPPGAAPAPEPGAETGATGDPGRWRWSGSGRTTTDGGDAEWGTRAWTYDVAGAAWSPGATPGTGPGTTGRRRPRPSARDEAEAPALPDLEALARRAAPRSLLALARRPDRRWRLLVALIAWPPVGYAVGTLLSSLTGCATFSAACPEPAPLLPLAAQPLVVAALLLVPPAAAMGAFASLVALAVAIPLAAVLSVGSLPEQQAGAGVLGTLIAIAYLVALAAGIAAVWRDGPGAHDGPGTGDRSP